VVLENIFKLIEEISLAKNRNTNKLYRSQNSIATRVASNNFLKRHALIQRQFPQDNRYHILKLKGDPLAYLKLANNDLRQVSAKNRLSREGSSRLSYQQARFDRQRRNSLEKNPITGNSFKKPII
jgi:hypothetical protein